MRLRIDLGYDGSDFAGWASQPGQRTVEATLAGALQLVLRLDASPRLTVAGRTDAGVHARGQVAHVDVREEVWEANEEQLFKRLGGVLPEDMRIRSVTVAPAHFDARFGAIERRYAYRVCDLPGGVDPLRRRDVVQHGRRLDVDAMNQAAHLLEGEHDFAAFCKKREGATTVRRLIEFSWTPGDEFHQATVRADAFCHNMVRSLVGACIAVGEGRQVVEWPVSVLGDRARPSAAKVMPAHGLTLEKVQYPSNDELKDRVSRARQVRAH